MDFIQLFRIHIQNTTKKIFRTYIRILYNNGIVIVFGIL